MILSKGIRFKLEEFIRKSTLTNAAEYYDYIKETGGKS